MPLLIQADLDRKLRIWLHRLVSASPPKVTNKPILCLNISTIDHIIQLDTNLLKTGIQLAAKHDKCSRDEVVFALQQAKQKGVPKERKAVTATHILESLVSRMTHQTNAGDRIQISSDTPEILDFLHDWFHSQLETQQQVQPGGAPAIIAQALTQLGEYKTALWTRDHSQGQALVFDEQVKFLVLENGSSPIAKPIHNTGRANDPEIHNYSLEFAMDCEYELRRADGTSVIVSATTADRVIAISPGYQYFDPETGHVITSKTHLPTPISHILTTCQNQVSTFVPKVAQEYKHWVIGGLHKVSHPFAQEALEKDLQQISPDVTLHTEISGPEVSTWFQRILQHYVNSIGVNIDDIEQLVQKMKCNGFLHTKPPENTNTSDLRREYLLRLAMWLACELNLERVYVHGRELDYIVRSDATDEEMNHEVSADLLAKIVVTNRAQDTSVDDRPPGIFGLSASNLMAFIELCWQRAFPLQTWGATLDGLTEFHPILDRGWFDDTFVSNDKAVKFRVAVVPVALFRLDPPGLKFVGAGDTTSAVSFVFGHFTTQRYKRASSS